MRLGANVVSSSPAARQFFFMYFPLTHSVSFFFYIYIYIQVEKSQKGKCTCRDSNLRHRFALQTKITRTIHHAIAPSSKKKTAQWRTSSTHNSIHTGVIGRCCHVHLKHQIHGANWKTPFCSQKGNQYWLRHLIQGVNWTMLYKDRKKGVRINSKSLERQVYAPRLEPTAPIRLADRNHVR